jgi:hypothetical protein
MQSSTQSRAPSRRLPRTSQRAEAFTFGQVSFEILTDEHTGPPGISEDLYARIEPGRAPHAQRHVVCSVHADPSSSIAPRPAVWNGDRAEVHGAGVRAMVTRLSPGIYVASCRISIGVEDVGPLLEALSAAVLADDHRPSVAI